MSIELSMPQRIWIEMHDKTELDACDVIVEMDDGRFYTALFVTLPYLRRQMQLSYEVSKTIADTPPARYAPMDTPHILVENLSRENIEDVIDNLIALDTFESLFTSVIEDDDETTVALPDQLPTTRPVTPDRRLSTAEMAAVVVTEVLKAESDTTVA